jgi:hypothetical protein
LPASRFADDHPAVTRVALSVVAGVLLVLATPADARFHINRSMEGVQLGMSRAEVRELKGTPDARRRGPDFVSWIYRRPHMEVTFKPRVITLSTNSRRIRGPRDIGIGTSKRRLKRVIERPVSCQSAEGAPTFCVVGSLETGRRYTVFTLAGGRADSIDIGISTP